MAIDINFFKNLLEKEKIETEDQLRRFAKKVSENDWQPIPVEVNIQSSEEGEAADLIEETENRLALEKELDSFLNLYFDKLEALIKARISTFTEGIKQLWQKNCRRSFCRPGSVGGCSFNCRQGK